MSISIHGFTLADDGRAWNEDGSLGLARNDDGSLALLDSEGYPANHTLDDDDAAHILNKTSREGLDPSETTRRWDYYASAA